MSSCSDCCDSCQTCIDCNATCNTCQSFCELGNQLAKDNDLTPPWPSVFNKGDIIIKVLPRETYNKAWDYIESAASLGTPSTEENQGKTSGDWTGTKETRNFIYADKTNELIAGIESLGGGTKVQNIPRPFTKDINIIYASYFTEISKAMNALLLHADACDTCNLSCNVTCDTCDSCDTCEDSNAYWPSSWHGSWSGSWSGSDPGGGT